MKKEQILFLAGGFGVLAGLTFWGIQKYLTRKHHEYNDYYLDFHQNF